MRNAAEERLVHCCGTKETEIVRVRDMPSSLDGLVRHNIENAMATSAAALAIGLPLDSLIKTLTGYTLSFEDSPGRLNIHDVGGARVIIDYAHNVDSIDRIGRLLEQMPVAGRRLCMMSISTRHFPQAIDELAAAAAPFFDHFVVAGSFRRGIKHPVEETARLMGESLVKAGVERNRIEVEADEYRAIENALKLVRPNDLLLLLAGRRHEFAWEKVRAMGLNDTAQEGRAGSDDAKREPPELDTARQTEAHAK